MVKKLLKYEFASFSKTILPMEIVLLGIAVLTRVIQFFETDSNTYSIFITSTAIMLGIAMVVCIVMTFVVCLVRFYKNLYTAEGYLTLTLPVTHTKHILAKLISSVLATVFSFISVFVAFAIATAGDVFNETVKAGVWIYKLLLKEFKWQGGLYTAEIIALVLISIITTYLIMFTCITVGQMARKNRVLAAFGVYFGYYIAKQLLATILLIVFITNENFILFRTIIDFAGDNPEGFVHFLLCGMILLLLIESTVLFIIQRFIMKKKLNIE